MGGMRLACIEGSGIGGAGLGASRLALLVSA